MEWREFEESWGAAFEKAKSQVRLMQSYPEMTALLELGDLTDPGDHISEQQDWVRLVSKLDHPVDSEFFSPSMMPLSKGDYELFLDFSSEPFSIFRFHYYFLEPYRWMREELYPDLASMLVAFHSKELLPAPDGEPEKTKRERIQKILRAGQNSIEASRIPGERVSRDQVWPWPGTEIVISENKDQDFTLVEEVLPMVVGLFPYGQPVILRKLRFEHGDPWEMADTVRTIRDLVCLLRFNRWRNAIHFKIVLPLMNLTEVVYTDGKFCVHTCDEKIIAPFRQNLDDLRDTPWLVQY